MIFATRAGLAVAPAVDSPPHPALGEARATTHRVARTFALACRLLPRAVRDDVHLLYLVFRTLDDLVDDGRPEAEARVDAVAAWAEGRPGERTREVDVLGTLAARHPLPRAAVAEFCAGMRQDLACETFATEADVDRYCYRVAGTIGLVMTAVLGARDPPRARPAAVALGIAMQRTNMLRDIDEDAANGRVYVAQDAVMRHGSLQPGRRAGLLREQIAYADVLYERGLAGIDELRSGARAVAAAAAMYREILREIERHGYGATPGRARVPGPRKLAVAARAVWRRP
ncbi:MAG TPA: phytoene/squalene synthase family protein [Solirubrobacteraceae bacterium]|jgi:phytoene synthase|nr:phytoene/squalene synthase family protein [Solirubrobacteraceae bacterium]